MLFDSPQGESNLSAKCIAWALNAQSAMLSVQKISSLTPVRIRTTTPWTKPTKDCLKLNVDAAVDLHWNKSAAGGVLRDSSGH